jgi:hypothetical protein
LHYLHLHVSHRNQPERQGASRRCDISATARRNSFANRSINVVGADTLTASFNVPRFSGRLEGGYRITSWAPVSVIPYAAV